MTVLSQLTFSAYLLSYFPFFFLSQQPASGVAYSHPTTVGSYTVHQAPVAAHTVTAAYAPAAATVAVARPAPVAMAAAATAAYGGYPTAHTATDYGYTQRQQEAPPPPPPVTTQNYQVTSGRGGGRVFYGEIFESMFVHSFSNFK